MKKQIATISSLIIFACGLAHADVAAQFEEQEGGTSGKGTFNRVPMTWEASQPIMETRAVSLAVRNFSRHDVTFAFEKPVDITQVILQALNRTSKGRIRFYTASGDIIDSGGDITTTNRDGTPMDSFATHKMDSVDFASRSAEDNAIITFQPMVRNVSKIIVEVHEDAGNFGITLRGASSK